MTTTVRDMWATHAGPNVLAWSYRDEDPECLTIYTVFLPYPGGRPRLQFDMTASGRGVMAVPIDNPERFGPYDTPREFAAWARAWKDAGDSRRIEEKES